MKVPGRRGGQATTLAQDEALGKMDPARLRLLRPVFAAEGQDGTVTAGNSSPITDGAAAVVLMSAGRASQAGCKVSGDGRVELLTLAVLSKHPPFNVQQYLQRAVCPTHLMLEISWGTGACTVRYWAECWAMRMLRWHRRTSQLRLRQQSQRHWQLQGSSRVMSSTGRSTRPSALWIWSTSDCWALTPTGASLAWYFQVCASIMLTFHGPLKACQGYMPGSLASAREQRCIIGE